MIPGYGTGNAIELYMEDKTGGEMEPFYNSINQFILALNHARKLLWLIALML